jgi:catechol 2,3-dioxygenase-like lactoylglutathione lyase family enzyme
MPSIDRLLETALYVDDLERSVRFYQDVFSFESMEGDSLEFEGRVLYPLQLPGRSILLLFLKGSCTTTAVLPGGTIPPHDGSGQLHLAFAVAAAELDGWRERLQSHGVRIEGEMAWPRGGRSLYFRDPDGHLLELATPGVWSNY